MAKNWYSKIMDQGLVWTVAVLGLPLTFYGIWFQTEGFVLMSLYTCFIPFIIGLFIGLLIMNSMLAKSRHPEPGRKKVTILGIKPMIRGYIYCFFICMLLVYRARVPMYFLIGIGGMTLSAVIVLYFLIWRECDKRKNQVGNTDIKNS